ncbi:FAD-dependent oxidoreductase [Streptomyces sp. NPDC001852]|uniref:FAD-dependent oxidoreductase n=1 Tax=Streptomyces sp. NPDC001852 TaxID=3364619 RepID=UPI00369A99B5
MRDGAEPARVAVVGPFSGPRAAWGRLLRDGAARAARPWLRWDFHDDRGDGPAGGSVAAAVVAHGGYDAVIGHFNSMGARAALPLYRAAGVPLVLPLATAPGLLDGGGGSALRWCATDREQAAALCADAAARGHRRLLVSDDGSEYGGRLADLFAEPTAQPPGLAVERTAALTRPTAPGTAVVVCGTHFGAARTARRLRAAGFAGQLYFTDDCAVAEFAELAGPAGQGARVARLRGGAPALVGAAFAALVAALETRSAGDGSAQLLAALRDRAGFGFTPDGDPVASSPGHGWEVVTVPATARRRRYERVASRSGTAEYDVIVIGAGVVGSATAAALSAAGRRVALTLPAPKRPGATDFSGGLVRAYEPEPAQRALAIRSSTLLWGRDPAARHADGPDFRFHRTGSLVLLGAEDLAEARTGVAELTAAGIEAHLLSPGEVHARFPEMAVDDLAGAVWEPAGGYAHPPAVARAHRELALRDGATALTGIVREVAQGPDGVRVTLDCGTVVARVAVLAAGAGTPAIAGHRLSAGSPAGSAPRPRLRTRRIRYAFFDRAGRLLPAVNDLVTGVWGRPQMDGPAAGGFLAGRPVDEWDVPAGGGEELTGEQVAHIRAGVRRRWPWLGHAACLGGRFGVDLYSERGHFLGAEAPESPLVLAAAWSGAGFKTAPAAAARAADAALALLARRPLPVPEEAGVTTAP